MDSTTKHQVTQLLQAWSSGDRDALDALIAAGHSRIPVDRETVDNIVGILYAKDLLPVLRDNTAAARLHEPRYNMLAYPWATRYQQSNQWALETLAGAMAVSYTHLRAHETVLDLVCRLLLEKKNTQQNKHASKSQLKAQRQQR